MNIAILGAGRIGTTIGLKWSAAGHQVRFGVRDPGSTRANEVLRSVPGATALSITESLQPAEVVLLALPGTAVTEVVKQHKAALNGTIIIDASNQVGRPVMHNMTLLAAELPKALTFRAFNSLGYEVFADPQFGSQVADHFFCGPGGRGRDIVAALITEVGLRPIYVGGPEAASLLDGLTRLWFALVFDGAYSRHTALKLLVD